MMLKPLIQALVRAKKPVLVKDLPLRIDPLSPVFGLERGTPIDRYYIESFLRRNSNLIQGEVLEIGEPLYTKKFGRNVQRSHVLHATEGNSRAGYVGDLTVPESLPQEKVDCFICTQTFNFIFDVQRAAEGAFQVLKPGGVLLATLSGISQISRYDMDRWGDYWRFTTASARKLFEPRFGGQVSVESFGNVFAATSFLQGLSVEDLPSQDLLEKNDPNYQMVITVVARRPN